jgi:hypothetical protein
MREREIEPQMDADSRRWSEGDVSFIYQLLAKNEFYFETCFICVHPDHLTPLRSVHVRCATIVVYFTIEIHASG